MAIRKTISFVFAFGLVSAYAYGAFTPATRVDSSGALSFTPLSMRLSSPSFENGETIPSAHTCDATQPTSPALRVHDAPEGTKSFVLLMDDPDVPIEVRPEGVFDHWVLYDIDPATERIPEGGSAGVVGENTRGLHAYAPPCPPPEYAPKEHRYVFRLYALDRKLDLPEGASKKEVLAALQNRVLEVTELVGRYQRASQ